MVREAGVQSQVESHQRLKKWYLIPPCLTLSIIRYRSRVKWCNPGRRVAPSPTPQRRSYWKGSLQVPLNNGHLLYLLYNRLTCNKTPTNNPLLLLDKLQSSRQDEEMRISIVPKIFKIWGTVGIHLISLTSEIKL